ncbi:BgTH12-07738 [Blumeria graminis f. sp. triticale]|uniref:BgTH12-07738 n=1 Tax=Blumeria graminis f. sp. triticale TaxID=1689686 RepID=A0A9W4GIQ3_BLUGR|nr:BgTH12-07738 [Blumeria graminis f. sp. triticale]
MVTRCLTNQWTMTQIRHMHRFTVGLFVEPRRIP